MWERAVWTRILPHQGLWDCLLGGRDMNESRNYVTAGQPLGMYYTTDIFFFFFVEEKEVRTKGQVKVLASQCYLSFQTALYSLSKLTHLLACPVLRTFLFFHPNNPRNHSIRRCADHMRSSKRRPLSDKILHPAFRIFLRAFYLK